jgi:lipopolysaccharide transport system permease protein
MRQAFSPIWQYRHFILGSVRNEFATRFARNRLGALWMILNPLAQVAIYTVIFSAALSAKLPGSDDRFGYAIYLMAGILIWSLFADIVNRCLTVFIDNGNLIKKIAFPKTALPVIVAGSALTTNLMLLCAIILVFLLIGHALTPTILWLPIPLFIALGLGLGLGLTLGILNVFIRDVGQFAGIILQFWFWLTPIVYTLNAIPEKMHTFFNLNPMTALVESCQRILIDGQAPDPLALSYPVLLAFALLSTAAFLFHRAGEEMVDVL